MRPFPNSSPLFGLMALLRSMCSKTCHAAEATSMVASFPLVRRMCLLALLDNCFLFLVIIFLGFFILSGSSDHCCSAEDIIAVWVIRWYWGIATDNPIPPLIAVGRGESQRSCFRRPPSIKGAWWRLLGLTLAACYLYSFLRHISLFELLVFALVAYSS